MTTSVSDREWHKDFDHATTQALPEVWEYRSHHHDWIEFDKHVSEELNRAKDASKAEAELTSTQLFPGKMSNESGLPTNNGNYTSSTWMVNFYEGVIYMKLNRVGSRICIRSTRPRNTCDPELLKQIYQNYAVVSNSDDGDRVEGEGFVKFFADLDVDATCDIAVLTICYFAKAEVLGILTRKEFMLPFIVLQVHSMEKLKVELPFLKAKLTNLKDDLFKSTYLYTFGVALEPGSRVLSTEDAVTYWQLLLASWPLLSEWTAFVSTKKAVNRDVWSMLYRFSLEFPSVESVLVEFDNSSVPWPIVVDDFAAFLAKNHSNVSL